MKSVAGARRILARRPNFSIDDSYGIPVPEYCLQMETSPALIEPLWFTSLRKLAALTSWPLCALACETSAAFVARLALVSPHSTPIGMLKSVVGASDAAPFTPLIRTLMFCWLVTLVSGTVTTGPLTETLPVHTPAVPTHPVPTVTCACGLPVTVTLPVKVTTRV